MLVIGVIGVIGIIGPTLVIQLAATDLNLYLFAPLLLIGGFGTGAVVMSPFRIKMAVVPDADAGAGSGGGPFSKSAPPQASPSRARYSSLFWVKAAWTLDRTMWTASFHAAVWARACSTAAFAVLAVLIDWLALISGNTAARRIM